MDLYTICIKKDSPIPLYAQLHDTLQQQIRAGLLPYGEKLPSENEFMEALNISRMTVRTALSMLAQDGYVEKQHGKGSFVSFRTDALQSKRVHVLLDVTYAYFSSNYIKSISEVLDQNGLDFVIHDTQDDQEVICSILEKLTKTECGGIILQPSHLADPIMPKLLELINLLTSNQKPMVLLDQDIPGVSVMKVSFDDFAGGKLAAEHLIGLGHQNFAMLCCSRFSENAPRFAGFQSALSDAGLPPLLRIEKNADLPENLLNSIRENQVTAVFAYNDEVALKAFHILHREGIRIPEDISVIGFDDTVFTKATYPQLTSIVHPKEYLGKVAANMLISNMKGTTYDPDASLLQPRISVRGSCGRIAVQNEV